VTCPGARRVVSNLKYVLRAYGDGTMFGEPYGEGPVRVVWLHGWARTAADFKEAATILAEHGVASVALDLPGFGASPAPERAGGAREYAGLVTPVLREIAQDPVVLVGHSFGGRVACVVAARDADFVRALVLTGVPLIRHGSSRSPLSYRLLRWSRRRGFVSEAKMEAARQRYGSEDYRNASGIMRDVLVINVNESYEPELIAVTSPVTLLWGELDAVVPEDVAQEASALLRTTHTMKLLPGVGHLVPTQAPLDLANTVMGLLG
jgi:pimeloyl-ACP methyl ester carboxylesterase